MRRDRSPHTASVTVQELVRMAERGEFAIPKLQRAFVWNGRKAAQLFDSILRGLPVGSITIWEASRQAAALLPNTHHILPSGPGARGKKLVMDGQQRLSVVYNAFKGLERPNARRQRVNFRNVCVRVASPDDGEQLTRYRKPVPDQWVSVADLMSGSPSCIHLASRKNDQRRLAEYRRRIAAFKIAVTTVHLNDVDAARDLFIRINSLGTPLAAADRAFAQAARLDVKDAVYAIQDDLPEAFRGIAAETILQALALVDEIDDVGRAAMDRVVKRWNARAVSADGKRRWDTHRRHFTQSVLKAVDLLKSFGVTSAAVLPSQYLLAVLTVFFSSATRITPRQKARLTHWFWATALGNRYSGRGFRTNITADARALRALAKRERATISGLTPIPHTDLIRATLSKRSSARDAVLCMLYLKGPRSLVDGESVLVTDPVALASKHHRHHVYPKAYLARQNITQHVDSICNIVLSSADANLAIGSKAPHRYLVSHGARRRAALRANLLPATVVDPLAAPRTKSYATFLEERARLIRQEVNRLAGARVLV